MADSRCLRTILPEYEDALLSGRAVGLAKDEAAIGHDGALGDPAYEPSPDWPRLLETRKIVEQSFVAIKLLAKNVMRLKDK